MVCGTLIKQAININNNNNNINNNNNFNSNLLFQLISMAVRNGDTHKHTMEMADYWLMVRADSCMYLYTLCFGLRLGNFSSFCVCHGKDEHCHFKSKHTRG